MTSLAGSGAPLVVLTEPADPTGPWLVDGLHERGFGGALNLTTDDLLEAVWTHSLGAHGFGFEARLPNGLMLDEGSIAAVINRVTYLRSDQVASMVEQDRDYAIHEANAFFMSWLASIEAPVFNPPSPRGLAGAWRSSTEWACLSSRVGLHYRSVDSSDPEPIQGLEAWNGPTAITLDGEIVDNCLDQETRRAAIALGVLCETPLLGLQFGSGSHGLEVTRVTPYPDLLTAGEAMLDAFAYVLERVA